MNMARRLLLEQLDVRSLIIFRALQLGDMLCSVPALRALRGALPTTQICLVGLPWASQFADRFSNYIDEFVAFPGHAGLSEQPVQPELVAGFYLAIQAREFSLAVQMHGSGEVSNGIVRNFGAQWTAGYAAPAASDCREPFYFPYPDTGPEPLRLLELATLLGAPPLGDCLEYPLTPPDWDELDHSGLGAGLEPNNYICIHPGARFRDKCWPPQHFARIADELALESRLTIVLTGSAKERDLTTAVANHMNMPAVNAAGPISIGAMAALMSQACLLICNDTGVSHIAAGLKLPSVVIFSRADISRWAPLDQHLHHCIWDPEGHKVDEVLTQARLLLAQAH